MSRYNPFRPGSIVTPGMFTGRGAELVALERILFQTRNGNPEHFLIQGERGIGKSSLLFALDHTARGDWTLTESEKLNFLTVGIELEPSNDYAAIIRTATRSQNTQDNKRID